MLFGSPIVAAVLPTLVPAWTAEAGGRRAEPQQPPAQQEPAPAEQAQNPNYFNPQISLIGDFEARLVDTGDDPHRKAIFRELELAFASDVDPFLRAEAYIAVENEFGEETKGGHGSVVDIEEAFGIYRNLGRGFQAKFGKIAGAVGRQNRNHRDQLNFLEYPFVIQDLFGEEGLRAPGGSISYLFPGERFHEVTVEALDVEDGALFGGAGADDPALVARYRTFFDFNEDTSAQLGFSFVNGPFEGERSSVLGGDFTMKWQPGTRGRSMVLETEGYWFDPGMPGAGDGFGGFAALTYEVMPRWFLTGKFDYSELPGTDDLRRAWSAGLTYKLTEFHHWRAELQRISSNFESDRTLLTLQFQWIIGAHPAHKY